MGLFTIRNIDEVLFFFNCNLWILFCSHMSLCLLRLELNGRFHMVYFVYFFRKEMISLQC